MEDIMSDIGTTPSLEPVTDENIMDLISSASALRQQSQQQDENSFDDLSSSFDSHNSSNKSLKCAFCGAVFDSYPALVEHRATHGGSRPYECHVCAKRFTQKAHLIIHRRTHTGEKPYSCHICHKRFSQTSHLNSHKRVHSGDKPFLCSLCNMGFCRRQRLEAHLQQHHANDLQQPTVSSNVSMNEGYSSVGDTAAALFSQMVSGVNAKELLISMGLSSILSAAMASAATDGTVSQAEEGRETGDGEEEGGDDGNDDTGHHISVFPGFSVDEEDDDEHEAEGDSGPENDEGPAAQSSNIDEHSDNNADSDGVGRESRSPTPNASIWSSSNTQASAAKSRRKPSFVRKLGTGNQSTVKKELTEDTEECYSADLRPEKNSSSSITVNSDQAAQKAAMKAILRMAARNDDANDSMNDGSTMDASITGLILKQSLLAAAAMAAAAGRAGGESQVSSNSFNTPTSHYGKMNSTGSPAKISAESAAAAFRASLSSMARSAAPSAPGGLTPLMRHNSRVSLLDFAAADLVLHLMSRDDAYRCDFCRVVFQDAAMYHLHRSQHDKMDIRKCNLCGHQSMDRFDFTAHFMSVHK